MFSLKDFFSISKKENRINILLFFLSFFIIVFILLILGLEKNKFLIFILTPLIYLLLSFTIISRIYKRFLKEHSDIVSYIFLREHTGKSKFDVYKNFTTAEVESFIQNLDCEKYIEFNNLPKEYYYRRNENYKILGFERDNLQLYTRTIPWQNISWKYKLIRNEGTYEYLSIQYKNESGKEIDE